MKKKPQHEKRVVHRTPENYAKLNQETASLYLQWNPVNATTVGP